MPAPFGSLTYDQYVSIRPKSGTAIWAGDNVGFAIEPLHRGFLFTAPMVINVVENGAIRRLSYAANQFDFGKVQAPPNLPDIGFSGFRVLHAHADQGLVDMAIFQGASFFRALANGQTFGLTARALMIRTADPRGEEIPAIREVWIERPSLANDVLVINALVDSDSMTGAYRLTLRPGDITIIDTECTLFTRSAEDFYGLGGMTAMFLFGPINRRGSDDIRAGRVGGRGPADPQRQQRMAVAPRHQSIDIADLRLSSMPIRAASGCCSAIATSTDTKTTSNIGS